MSKKYTVNQGCLSLSTYYLKYGRHLARLRRRRRRRRAYAPASNTASHDNHGKITSWVSFDSLYFYGAPLCGPSGHRSPAIKIVWFTLVINNVRKYNIAPKNIANGRISGTKSVTFKFANRCLDQSWVFASIK